MGIIVKDRPYHHFKKRVSPSGPILSVKISNSISGKRKSALAFIDSGADITCISEKKIQELEKILAFPLMIQSISAIDSKGREMEVQTYAMCAILESKFQYVPDNGILSRHDDFFGEEDMLIGRDILNNLKVILDGPNQTFTIEDPKHC